MYNSDGLIVVGGGGLTATSIAYSGASSLTYGVVGAVLVLCGLVLVRLAASRQRGKHQRRRGEHLRSSALSTAASWSQRAARTGGR